MVKLMELMFGGKAAEKASSRAEDRRGVCDGRDRGRQGSSDMFGAKTASARPS